VVRWGIASIEIVVWWKEGTTIRSARLMGVVVVEGDMLILDFWVAVGMFCCFGGGELLVWRLRMVYASYGCVVKPRCEYARERNMQLEGGIPHDYQQYRRPVENRRFAAMWLVRW
jgi:hypothetical protein